MQEEESEVTSMWEQFRRLVRSSRFESMFAAVVMVNFLWIGAQMEYREFINNASPTIVLVTDGTFCVAFLAELILRLVGNGIVEFFCSEKDWAWNWFDVVIVLLTTFETGLSLVGGLTNALEGVSGLRVVRVMRVLRVVRVIRGMRNFRPLRLLIHAIANTLRSAIWTLLLLMMIIYTFSVMFAQSTYDHLASQVEAGTPIDEDLSKNFGTLGRTLYTLFSASTGGCDWQDVAAPLGDVHFACLAGFIIYISFQYFCVMNVVTGIFCQSALEIAKNDREDMIVQQLQDKDRYVASLQDLFREWDGNGSGELSLEEFQYHMKDSRMQAFLRTLEIEPSNAFTLFKLLDADGQGTLDVSEFVGGLIELRGNAKSIQIHELLHETSLARDNLQRMFDYLVAVEEDKITREQDAVLRHAELHEYTYVHEDYSGTGSTADTLVTPGFGTPGSNGSGSHRTGGTDASRTANPVPGNLPQQPPPPSRGQRAPPMEQPPRVVAIDEV